MYKIGIIGDKDSVLGFMSVGFTVFDTDDAEKASELLYRLADEDYAVIYITEELAEKIAGDIDKFKSSPLPAIITIPGKGGSTGYGINNIKKSVERAVGADILFKE